MIVFADRETHRGFLREKQQERAVKYAIPAETRRIMKISTKTIVTVGMFTAVGMSAVFCGVTNCPITSLLISFELFGYDGMPYFLLAIAFSYMLSGYFGLYQSQKIVYSKYKTNYINKKTH